MNIMQTRLTLIDGKDINSKHDDLIGLCKGGVDKRTHDENDSGTMNQSKGVENPALIAARQVTINEEYKEH